MSKLPSEVQEMGQIHLEGNVIPHSWYQHIRFDNGKIDTISIILLSEIVYWYRPTVVRDESTGHVIEVRKKFKSDALQKSKKSLSKQFGFTERQVQESLARMEKMGLITREFRTVSFGDLTMGNVPFIKIHPEKIKQISAISPVPYNVETSEEMQSNATVPSAKRQTYTENTTKTTTENNSIAPAKADAKKKDSSVPLIKKKEHVSVSEDQHKKLVAKHGEGKTEQAYEFLNDWKESKAETDPKALAKHTDYYRITKWVMKEIESPTSTNFSKAKGKLALPTDGKIDDQDAAWRNKKL